MLKNPFSLITSSTLNLQPEWAVVNRLLPLSLFREIKEGERHREGIPLNNSNTAQNKTKQNKTPAGFYKKTESF